MKKKYLTPEMETVIIASMLMLSNSGDDSGDGDAGSKSYSHSLLWEDDTEE